MRACARGAEEGGQGGGVALSHLDESCAVCVWTGSGKDGCGDEERGAKERAKEPRYRGAPLPDLKGERTCYAVI